MQLHLCRLFDDEIAPYLTSNIIQCLSNTSYFRNQTTGTKNKCIDRVYIKVIDHRLRDRMDKMTMNQPLECLWSTLMDV